jgi:dTDP-4-dehydrorhamnose reductase
MTGGPILLLGAGGQIGFELRRSLAPLGSIAAPTHADLDICDKTAIARIVDSLKPKLIVNAAAFTDVDGAEANEGRHLAMAVNGEAPGLLAEAAARTRVPLVHYSTDYVFDGAATRPYREDDGPAPINAYGRSKLAGDERIAKSGAPHLIFRTSWIYARRRRNFLRTVQRLAMEQDELRVVSDQIGAPTWARMVAEATAAVLGRCWRNGAGDPLSGCGGLYHMAAAGETSWHGFAQAIVAAGGKQIPVRAVTSAEFPRPAKRPAYSALDSGKLARVFEVTLPDWRDQLALCLAE